MALIIPDVKMDFKEMISKFAIPTDIQVDLIYCQQKIVQYLQLHKIISGRLRNAQNKMNEYALRKSLNDIEKEICDITHEQNLLVIRLRECLEEYYTTLRKENVEVDRDLGNAFIAQQLGHIIENSFPITNPCNVKKRITRMEFLTKTKYSFECSQKNFTDEDPKKSMESIESVPMNNIKQESLLKPKSERIGLLKNSNKLYSSELKDLNEYKNAKGFDLSKDDIDTKPSTQPPARDIRNSRLNLLQALNKAKNQSMNMATKILPTNNLSTHADKPSEPVATSSSSSLTSSSRSSQSAASRSSASPVNSDDSLDAVPIPSPTYSDEHKNLDLIAGNKEAFLRQFGLFTREYCQILSQRRSKRRRRNVQSNEKSDYHYGNLDLFDRMDRKKKTFLYSPPATRSLKRKKSDLETVEEPEPTTTKALSLEDRSNSSSPDHQYLCNECFKNGEEALLQCINCSGPFHAKCHRGSISKIPLRLRSKMCPACLRNRNKDTSAESQYQLRDKAMREQKKLENVRLKAGRKSLWKNLGYIQKTMALKNNRKLLKNSGILQTRMAKFMNIVDTFKYSM